MELGVGILTDPDLRSLRHFSLNPLYHYQVTMQLVFISDTHDVATLGKWGTIPDGDVLIHAGDITPRGKLEQLTKAVKFFEKLPHKHKVFIAGNHDFCFEKEPAVSRAIMESAGLVYLENQLVEIDGLKIYGTPHQPWFYDWAFNVMNDKRREDIYSVIPENLDVLITHCPPYGILDRTYRGEPVGCTVLSTIVAQRKPKFHCFGHIHESYGVQVQDGVTYINASTCNLSYIAVNPPMVFEV